MSEDREAPAARLRRVEFKAVRPTCNGRMMLVDGRPSAELEP
jgi:hypothetical protein